MFVRSQDRLSLGDYTRFEIVKQDTYAKNKDGEEFVVSSIWVITGGTPAQDYGHILGQYSTEEKALKVLDMMQAKLNRSEGIFKVNCSLSDKDRNTVEKRYKEMMNRGFMTIDPYMDFYPVPFVFQMPQDSEVE